ncbi:MAG: iron-containing alcohol dehydrogenase [bacterium]|nr:iron-containing alcohol dehydrogenase [bacterium]
MKIESHRGPYQVHFVRDAIERLKQSDPERSHLILDQNVAKLYAEQLKPLRETLASVLVIEATESAKSLESFPEYVSHLVANKIRRNHKLIAIGGGIIQDITCFIALTILRGIPWKFVPTTLLAQADSCIGSKSSINVGDAKNILGSFLPPDEILIDADFLETLEPVDVLSGIGEIIKVHVIDGPQSFAAIQKDYDRIRADREVLRSYNLRALEIKKRIIEEDEFDKGPRNVMNYGHSFGHAIESATNFAIPHGLAVTIGMDMANYVSSRLKVGSEAVFAGMHQVMFRNYESHRETEIPLEAFLNAIGKDKKNQDGKLGLILPDADAHLAKHMVPNDQLFQAACSDFLTRGRVEQALVGA